MLPKKNSFEYLGLHWFFFILDKNLNGIFTFSYLFRKINNEKFPCTQQKADNGRELCHSVSRLHLVDIFPQNLFLSLFFFFFFFSFEDTSTVLTHAIPLPPPVSMSLRSCRVYMTFRRLGMLNYIKLSAGLVWSQTQSWKFSFLFTPLQNLLSKQVFPKPLSDDQSFGLWAQFLQWEVTA